MHKLALTTALALAMIAPAHAAEPLPAMATAVFMDLDGAELGSVTLTQRTAGVVITGELTGLKPGLHGIHFHETGNCDASTKFESAGKHFNPTDHKHGLDSPDGPHAGDLPNITAATDGTASIDLTTDRLSLKEGDPAYVFDADGTALVIHADVDDNVTDPSGNSGDRIACAVIEASTAP